MQEERQKNLWVNIYSIKSRVSFNVLLIIFILFLFLAYTINRFNFYIESAKQTGAIIEQSEYESMNLFNQMEQTNQILQNQLINQVNDNNATRRKIWSEKIIPSLQALNEIEREWISSELKLKLSTIEMNLKKLRKDQDAIEDLFNGEVEKKYFQDINQQGLDTRLTSKSVYNRNLVPLIGQLHRLFEDFMALRQEEYKQQRKELESRIAFFWFYAGLVSVLTIIAIIFSGWNVAKHIDNRFQQLREYTRVLSKGNLSRNIQFTRDETYAIIGNIKHLNQQLSKIQQIAENVKTGKLDQKIEVFESKGEIGEALSKMQDDLKSVAQRDFQRNWTNEGIALFGNLLRQYDDAQALYDLLVANLVRYLKANQGGVFILNDNNERKQVLELKSIYAFDRKRFIEKRVASGQGLVGQAWKEKDSIYIEQTSEDYLKISSGLGGAKPRSLLIVPMINNDLKVLGVLEIASFQVFKKYEIELIKRIAEMIVSAISSIKNNEKNRILLAEAQRTTDQMKSKEEEMSSKIAALSKAQEEMQFKQTTLSTQIRAIERTLGTIELNPDGEIIQINKILADLLLYHPDEVIGKHYDTLLSPAETNDASYIEFWDKLIQGHTKQKQVKLLNKAGEPVWLNAIYTPIKGKKEKITKIIQMGIDITEQLLSNLQYQSQLSAIQEYNAVIEFDIHGFIVEVNEVYLRMLGYKYEELIGKHHSVVLPENDRESDEFITFWDKLSRGEAIQGRFCRLHRNGKLVWIWATFNTVLDYDKKPYRIISIAQDITSEVNTEQDAKRAFDDLKAQQILLEENHQKMMQQEQERIQLTEQHKQLQIQAENQQQSLQSHLNAINSTIASLELDMDTNILHANDLMLKMLGYKLSEIKGVQLYNLQKTEDNSPEANAKIWEKLKNGYTQSQEIKVLTKNNQTIYLKASYTPIKNHQQKTYKVLNLAFQIPQKDVN